MTETYMVEPDLEFIKEVGLLGAEDLKKCYQCATCSVACPISPDHKPFPRKEMIAASWGMKDQVLKSADIWLCHNCGDCTTRCPREAKPGDVLAALRTYAIQEYAVPKKMGKLVNDPKKLPLLLAVPVVLFLVVGILLKMFGIHWLNFSPSGEEIVHAKFFSTWLVDLIFIPTFLFAIGVFALGLTRFVGDIHEEALKSGKTENKKIDPKGFIEAFIRVIPEILKHKKFSQCGENADRATSHMMVLYGFIGLFIVTNIFFITLYVFGIHGPYSQLNPVKWLANIAGVALVIGAILMIKDRLTATEQISTYKDWFLVTLALLLGVTGMLTEMTRLGGAAGLSYTIYFIHLVFVWALFAYVPYSKLAHLVYRTVAMAYAEYTERS